MKTTFTLAALLIAAPLYAAPITLGAWQPVLPPSELGDMPWSHVSYDGSKHNAGYVLGLGQGELAHAEYLSAAFAFPGWNGTEIFSWTAFTQGAISQSADGRFLYANPETGDHYDSGGSGWRQFVLLRQMLSPHDTAYWLLVEDMDLAVLYGSVRSDLDYQDHISKYIETEPTTVPEPVTLALFGVAALAGARRWRRRG